MCREGAWTELTVRVTPVIAVQSETHGLNIYNNETSDAGEQETVFAVSFEIRNFHF